MNRKIRNKRRRIRKKKFKEFLAWYFVGMASSALRRLKREQERMDNGMPFNNILLDLKRLKRDEKD